MGLTAAEATILRLLAERGPLYGQELVDASDGALGRGTVYVWATGLEDRGLIEGVAVARGRGRQPQRRYWLTEDGARALAAHETRGAGLRLA